MQVWFALYQALNFIEYDSSFSEEEKQLSKPLKVSCKLNNAACKLKLKDYKEAKELCTEVLWIKTWWPSHIILTRISWLTIRWCSGPGAWQHECEGFLQKGTGTHVSCWLWFGRTGYQESTRNRSRQQVIPWSSWLWSMLLWSLKNHMPYWRYL